MADAGGSRPGAGALNAARGAGPGLPEPAPARRRTTIPFAVHQGLEYGLGVLLIQGGVHLVGRAADVCVVTGVVVILLAAGTDGRLGAGRLPIAVHRVVDVVIAALLLASPWLTGFASDASGIVIAETAAGGLVVLIRSTNYARDQRRRRRGPAAAARPTPSPASSSDGSGPREAARGRRPLVSEETVVASAQVARALAHKAKTDGARAVGRRVGRYLARHRPEPGGGGEGDGGSPSARPPGGAG